MRISGGVAKGRNIGTKKAFSKKVEDSELRPTSSKVREALFDIIRDKVSEASFLDLYAGTGAVGIEALSRGTRNAVFVESDLLRAKLINNLLIEFKFKDKARVVKMSACDFVLGEGRRGHKYDIVFVDPPYHSEELMKILPLIGRGDILEAAGIVVVEHFSKVTLPDIIGDIMFVKHYKYGDTTLSLYRLERI